MNEMWEAPEAATWITDGRGVRGYARGVGRSQKGASLIGGGGKVSPLRSLMPQMK